MKSSRSLSTPGAVVVIVLGLVVGGVDGRSRGDRPGELRLSAMGSYGHRGPEWSNNAAFWATKPRKHMGKLPEKEEGDVELIFPGTREALHLHSTDKRVTKGIKLRAQSRSSSARARSQSAMSRGRSSQSRTRSDSSTVVDKTVAGLVDFFSSDDASARDMMRVLRMTGTTGRESGPPGLWTSKSRPASVLRGLQMTTGERRAEKAKRRKFMVTAWLSARREQQARASASARARKGKGRSPSVKSDRRPKKSAKK